MTLLWSINFRYAFAAAVLFLPQFAMSGEPDFEELVALNPAASRVVQEYAQSELRKLGKEFKDLLTELGFEQSVAEEAELLREAETIANSYLTPDQIVHRSTEVDAGVGPNGSLTFSQDKAKFDSLVKQMKALKERFKALRKRIDKTDRAFFRTMKVVRRTILSYAEEIKLPEDRLYLDKRLDEVVFELFDVVRQIEEQRKDQKSDKVFELLEKALKLQVEMNALIARDLNPVKLPSEKIAQFMKRFLSLSMIGAAVSWVALVFAKVMGVIPRDEVLALGLPSTMGMTLLGGLVWIASETRKNKQLARLENKIRIALNERPNRSVLERYIASEDENRAKALSEIISRPGGLVLYAYSVLKEVAAKSAHPKDVACAASGISTAN